MPLPYIYRLSLTDCLRTGRKSWSHSQRRRRSVTKFSHGASAKAKRIRLMRPYTLDRQIPSILSYIDGEEFHGTQAKSQLVRNSKNTVAYFRDFLGREYDNVFRGLNLVSDTVLQLRLDRPDTMSRFRTSSEARRYSSLLDTRYLL